MLKGQVGAADAAPSELARLAADAPELAAFYEHINGVDIAWRFREMPYGSGAICVRRLDELFAFREEDEEHQFGSDQVAFSFDLHEYDDAEEWTWFVRNRETGASRLVYADARYESESAHELATTIPDYLRRAMDHGGVGYWPACFRETGLDYGHAEHAVRRFRAPPVRTSLEVGHRVQFELGSIGQGRGDVLALHDAGFVHVRFDEGTVGWIPRANAKRHVGQDDYERLRDPKLDLRARAKRDADGLVDELALALDHRHGLFGSKEELFFHANASQAAGLLDLRSLDEACAFVVVLFQKVWSLGRARHDRRRVDVDETSFLVTPALSAYSAGGIVSSLLGGLVIRAAHESYARKTSPAALLSGSSRELLGLVERVVLAADREHRAKVRPPPRPLPDLGMVRFLLSEVRLTRTPSFLEYLTQQPDWNERKGMPRDVRIYT